MKLSSELLLPLLAVFVSEASAVDVDHDQRSFLRGKNPSRIPLFELTNFQQHTTALFHKMDRGHAKDFIKFISASTDAQADIRENWSNKSRAASYYSKLTSEDIRGVDPAACRYLGLGLDLKPSIFEHAPEGCVLEIIRLAEKKYMPRESLAKLGLGVIRSHGPKISKQLGGFLDVLTSNQLEELFKNPDNCAFIKAKRFGALKDTKKMSAMTPQCFAKLSKLYKGDIEMIHKARNDVLAHLDRFLDDRTYPRLTAAQAKEFGSRLENNRCRKLKIELLNVSSASELSGNCFCSWLQQYSNSGAPSIKNHLPKMGDNIFAEVVREEPLLLTKLAISDWENIRTPQLEIILRNEDACKYIPADIKIKNFRNVDITPKIFADLPSNLQAEHLTGGSKLDADILSYVTDAMVQQWSIRNRNGLELLDMIKTENDIQQIIENMSKRAMGDHACRAIKSFNELRPIKNLVEYMTDECFNALSFEITAEEARNYPTILVLQSTDALLQATEENLKIWRNMTPSILEQLSKRSTFCQQMNKSIYDSISDVALRGLSGKCVSQLPFRSELTAADFAKCADDVFGSFTDKQLASIGGWAKVADRQVGHVSSANSDANSNAIKLLDAEVLKTWNPARLAKLTSSQWKLLKPELFASLSLEQYNAIPPKAMTTWTYSQAKFISPTILESTSAEQIQDLGTDVPAADSAVEALRPVFARLGKEAVAVASKRLNGASSIIPSISLVALLIPALALF